MRKGEVWLADLNPVKGSEQAGKRPVVIVSGNLLNSYAPVVWICPISTKIKEYKGDLVVEPNSVNGLTQTSEVIIMHLRSVSKKRLEVKLGDIERSDLEKLRLGLKETLMLD